MKLRCLGSTVGLLGLCASIGVAGSMRLEGEREDAQVLNLGGADAVARLCGEASGNLARGGLDLDGEYVEFKLSLDGKYCFRDSLRADGLAGQTWQFRLLVLPAVGEDPIAESPYPAMTGHGIACPIQFEEISTGQVYCLEAGDYRLRVIRVGDGDTRLDYLDLWDSPTPVDEASWGRVKVLFVGP
jgi:hypothetical protein